MLRGIIRAATAGRRTTAFLLAVNVVLPVMYVTGSSSSILRKLVPQAKKVEKHKTVLKLPLEVTGSRVGQKSINLGEEFDSDSDWLKNLKVTVKNKSDKTITWASITFRFPDTRASGPVKSVEVFIGQRSDQSTHNSPLSLEPEQELEFSPNLRVDAVKESMAKRGSLAELDHLDIEVQEVMFEDGTLYSGDNIWRRNPDSTSVHKWIKIGPYVRQS
jgi:hypothetical protein